MCFWCSRCGFVAITRYRIAQWNAVIYRAVAFYSHSKFIHLLQPPGVSRCYTCSMLHLKTAGRRVWGFDVVPQIWSDSSNEGVTSPKASITTRTPFAFSSTFCLCDIFLEYYISYSPSAFESEQLYPQHHHCHILIFISYQLV